MSAPLTTILSWNILQGGGTRAHGQADKVIALNPDFVCLQEFRNNEAGRALIEALASIGLTEAFVAPGTGKANSQLLASREKFSAELFPPQWTGKPHLVRAVFPGATIGRPVPLTLYAVHFPHKKEQIPLFDALLDVRCTGDENALIIGDLNCGIPFEDSDTKTFSNTHMFSMLLNRGWTDAWRSRHDDAREFTWISKRSGNGFRYDHVLATDKANHWIESVQYRHDWRDEGLSDHSPLIVQLAATRPDT